MHTKSIPKNDTYVVIPGSNPKHRYHCRSCSREYIPSAKYQRLCTYCTLDREVKAKYKK